ncbi:MAG: hypothetical protein ACM3OO_01170 [Planctomycetaceae bacterium]
MRRYLIVANHPRFSPSLLDLVRAKAAEDHSLFHVVVPAAPPKGGSTWTEEHAYAKAAERLESVLARLRILGVRADGEVGDASPLLAASDALRRSSFDAILLSTLPAGPSRWFRLDLPSRMRASFAVPVLDAERDDEADLVA